MSLSHAIPVSSIVTFLLAVLDSICGREKWCLVEIGVRASNGEGVVEIRPGCQTARLDHVGVVRSGRTLIELRLAVYLVSSILPSQLIVAAALDISADSIG